MSAYKLRPEADKLQVDILLTVGALRACAVNREIAELARRLLDWRSFLEVLFELGRRHEAELGALMRAPEGADMRAVVPPPAAEAEPGDLDAWLESRAFFELLEAYRGQPIGATFEAVKSAIRKRGRP